MSKLDWDRTWRKKQKDNGRCRCCANPIYTQRSHTLCEYHVNIDRERTKLKQQNLKAAVIAHYGGSCMWPGCGETDLDVLSVDHIHDDGADERRQFGSRLYRLIVKQGYPDRYQVLCMNHQWKKRMLTLRGENLPPLVAGNSSTPVYYKDETNRYHSSDRSSDG